MALPETDSQIRIEPATQDLAPLTQEWRARSRVILSGAKSGPVRVEIIASGLDRAGQVKQVTEMAHRLKALLEQPADVLQRALQLIAAEDELATAQSKVTQAREALRTVTRLEKIK